MNEDEKIVGYDLDGVLCNLAMGNSDTNHDIYKIWKNEITAHRIMLPIEKKYILISARPKRDLFATRAWCVLNDIKPLDIYHIGELDGQERLMFHDKDIPKRKLKIMIENGITKFYEDDESNVEYFRKNSDIEIIHVKHKFEFILHCLRDNMEGWEVFCDLKDLWDRYLYYNNLYYNNLNYNLEILSMFIEKDKDL